MFFKNRSSVGDVTKSEDDDFEFTEVHLFRNAVDALSVGHPLDYVQRNFALVSQQSCYLRGVDEEYVCTGSRAANVRGSCFSADYTTLCLPPCDCRHGRLYLPVSQQSAEI